MFGDFHNEPVPLKETRLVQKGFPNNKEIDPAYHLHFYSVLHLGQIPIDRYIVQLSYGVVVELLDDALSLLSEPEMRFA